MTHVKRDTADYVTTLESGAKLAVPEAVLEALNLREGVRVRIRVSTGALDRSLVRRGVTDDEVAEIVGMQLEDRDAVLRFLKTEGAWKKSGASPRRSLRRR
jgi:antitoxin component of MazEF toxin-antitoxin module